MFYFRRSISPPVFNFCVETDRPSGVSGECFHFNSIVKTITKCIENSGSYSRSFLADVQILFPSQVFKLLIFEGFLPSSKNGGKICTSRLLLTTGWLVRSFGPTQRSVGRVVYPLQRRQKLISEFSTFFIFFIRRRKGGIPRLGRTTRSLTAFSVARGARWFASNQYRFKIAALLHSSSRHRSENLISRFILIF